MSWNSKEPRWHGENKPKGNPRLSVINGQEFDLISYGEGGDDLPHPKCDDCGVQRGSLHQFGLRPGAAPALWEPSDHV